MWTKSSKDLKRPSQALHCKRDHPPPPRPRPQTGGRRAAYGRCTALGRTRGLRRSARARPGAACAAARDGAHRRRVERPIQTMTACTALEHGAAQVRVWPCFVGHESRTASHDRQVTGGGGGGGGKSDNTCADPQMKQTHRTPMWSMPHRPLSQPRGDEYKGVEGHTARVWGPMGHITSHPDPGLGGGGGAVEDVNTGDILLQCTSLVCAAMTGPPCILKWTATGQILSRLSGCGHQLDVQTLHAINDIHVESRKVRCRAAGPEDDGAFRTGTRCNRRGRGGGGGVLTDEGELREGAGGFTKSYYIASHGLRTLRTPPWSKVVGGLTPMVGNTSSRAGAGLRNMTHAPRET